MKLLPRKKETFNLLAKCYKLCGKTVWESGSAWIRTDYGWWIWICIGNADLDPSGQKDPQKNEKSEEIFFQSSCMFSWEVGGLSRSLTILHGGLLYMYCSFC
jgi:hypothetical protein